MPDPKMSRKRRQRYRVLQTDAGSRVVPEHSLVPPQAPDLEPTMQERRLQAAARNVQNFRRRKCLSCGQ